MKKRPRGRPRVGDKRRQLLDAALRMFAGRGYHGTAVPEVAAAAGVGTGTLYRHFATKEALVNEVYRDAKSRLGAALLTGLDREPPGEAWFLALWSRLGAFARAEPDTFRFLEMQDHAPYLDEPSRQVEMGILGPLWAAGQALAGEPGKAPLPVDVAIALIWGAFVGLLKAERLGYLALSDEALLSAGRACWRVVAPQETGADRTGADRTGAARTGADRTGADRTGADRTGAWETDTHRGEATGASPATRPTEIRRNGHAASHGNNVSSRRKASR
ncbi:MAG: TetR/AcrR family transcriptional regulator [Polyangiaceae bacterium]